MVPEDTAVSRTLSSDSQWALRDLESFFFCSRKEEHYEECSGRTSERPRG